MPVTVLKYPIVFFLLIIYTKSLPKEEERAIQVLKEINAKAAIRENSFRIAAWKYETNITNDNLQLLLKISEKVASEVKEDYQEMIKFNWKNFTSYSVRRQFQKLCFLYSRALPNEKYSYLIQVRYEMENIISSTKLCEYANRSKCNVQYRQLYNIMTESTNSEELKYYWLQWHNAVGEKLKSKVIEYIELMNEGAQLNNMRDMRDVWNYLYDTSDFQYLLKKLWDKFKPLYLNFHAYIRFKLKTVYGNMIQDKGLIPVHLVGEFFGQRWENLAKITMPYLSAKTINITEQLNVQFYTPLSLFKTADDLFLSINLKILPRMFWDKSLFEEPKGNRSMFCYSSTWDFSNGIDYRIKHCAKIDRHSYWKSHESIAKIHYYLEYRNQPFIFQNPPSPAFANAVGNGISLSAVTLNHYKKLGLSFKKVKPDVHDILNNLFLNALMVLPAVPFAYAIDLWKWEVFHAKNAEFSNHNCLWWKLMNDYLGVEAPVTRSNENFDISSYKIITNDEFSKFIALVLQYQFHRALCVESGQYYQNDELRPLCECDIYGSINAGNVLKSVMKMGSSKPWMEALEIFVGKEHMDIQPMLEYFSPLRRWLEAENTKNGVQVGWDSSTSDCH